MENVIVYTETNAKKNQKNSFDRDDINWFKCSFTLYHPQQLVPICSYILENCESISFFFSSLIQQYLIDHWSDDFKTCWFVEKCYNSLLSLATSRTSIQIFKNQREKINQNDWHKLIDLTSSKTLSHTHTKCNNVNSHAICLENCFLSSFEFHWNVIYIKRN